MIKVIVKPSCRTLVSGAAELEVEASSMEELIEELNQQYPGFRENILNARGSIRRSVEFYLLHERVQDRRDIKPGFGYRSDSSTPGYQPIEPLEDLHTQLPDDATVEFSLRNIAGG
jgi:molybdopterin synthase sulfur carrier subunit